MTLPVFSWLNFLGATIILLLVYLLMRLTDEFLSRQLKNNRWLTGIEKGLYKLLKVYEIIVFLILGSVFIFINPLFHGVILLAVVLFSFSHIKNYVSGNLASLDGNLSVGKRLDIGSAKGVIVKMGQLGIQLRTSTGIRFVSYTNLFSEGYNLVAVEEIGGFYQFELLPKDKNSSSNHIQRLMDEFLMTPYIDPSRQPELIHTNHLTGTMEARILIREDSNLDDFIHLINDWGYQCKVKEE
jgi:hypothetical protein